MPVSGTYDSGVLDGIHTHSCSSTVPPIQNHSRTPATAWSSSACSPSEYTLASTMPDVAQDFLASLHDSPPPISLYHGGRGGPGGAQGRREGEGGDGGSEDGEGGGGEGEGGEGEGEGEDGGGLGDGGGEGGGVEGGCGGEGNGDANGGGDAGVMPQWCVPAAQHVSG